MLLASRMHIELSNVTKEYGSQLALREVSLSIEASQIVAVLGANGAGKTTMLRLLAGLVGPSSGELRYDHQIFSRNRTPIDLIPVRPPET
jgi:ABC-type multidrug transport system ATPase subunit